MLVLTVRPGESIKVGETVIVFVEKRNEAIRLGVQAHASVQIQKVNKPTKDGDQC